MVFHWYFFYAGLKTWHHEIGTKMLKKLREKLGVKFLLTTHGYSMVKIACLDAVLEFFELEANPVEGQSWQQRDKKKRNRKGQKTI